MITWSKRLLTGQIEVTAISVFRHRICRRNHLLNFAVLRQRFAQLGYIEHAARIRPAQDLIDVVANATHLIDQHRHVCRRRFLDLRAIQQVAAKALTGQAGLANLLGQALQFVLGKIDFYTAISLTHIFLPF